MSIGAATTWRKALRRVTWINNVPFPVSASNSLARLQPLPAFDGSGARQNRANRQARAHHMTRGIAIYGNRNVGRDLCMRQATGEFGAGHIQEIPLTVRPQNIVQQKAGYLF